MRRIKGKFLFASPLYCWWIRQQAIESFKSEMPTVWRAREKAEYSLIVYYAFAAGLIGVVLIITLAFI